MAAGTGTDVPSGPRYSVKRQSVPSRPDPAAADAAAGDAADDAPGEPAWLPVEEHAETTRTAVSARTGPMAPPRRRVGTDVLPSGRVHRPVDRRAARMITVPIVPVATRLRSDAA